MSFDFFAEQSPSYNNKQPNNLEEIMHRIDHNSSNHSFDFDHFEPVDQNNQHNKSDISDLFKTQNKEDFRDSARSQEGSQEFQFDHSRDIAEISYIQENGKNNRSFKFENAIKVEQPKFDQRYQKLKGLLNKAKTNNLDAFYRNVDSMNAYPLEQNRFANKNQFKQFKNQFKAQKREKEQEYLQKIQKQKIKQPQSYRSGGGFSQTKELFGNYLDQQNIFKKKPNENDKFFLPMDYVHNNDDDQDFFEVRPEQIRRRVEEEKQKQYMKEAQNFFSEDPQNMEKPKKQIPLKKLETIREQKPTFFEEEKLTKLLDNYQELKYNYNSLMVDLKDANQDQSKILDEIKRLQTYKIKESRMHEEHLLEKKQRKEKQKQEKTHKINEIKEQIHKIKQQSQKDLLFLKINERIQSLESIVKTAINDMNEEKEAKFFPKIINYYDEPRSKSKQQSERSKEVSLSRSQKELHESSRNKEGFQEEYIGNIKWREEQKCNEQYSQQYNPDQLSSPLQLDFSAQLDHVGNGNLSQQQSRYDENFKPADKSKEYLPKTLENGCRNLRKCFTQKSSVAFQSFQFYITSKFTITESEITPVICEVRVGNKCSIDLIDVFVVIYGPKAIQLNIKPSKIMHDKFKSNTSFIFQVDLNKQCLEDGGFSMQVSYKTDSVNKKKVNLKIVLPMLHLMKPEFIYEEQFTTAWEMMAGQTYVKPKALDFRNIRTHQDLKLLMPFTEISELDVNSFSYGLMFHYPKSKSLFMLKITCYINGKASIHLRSDNHNDSIDKKLKEQILDVINFLIYI